MMTRELRDHPHKRIRQTKSIFNDIFAYGMTKIVPDTFLKSKQKILNIVTIPVGLKTLSHQHIAKQLQVTKLM